jgi:hypothetical protein
MVVSRKWILRSLQAAARNICTTRRWRDELHVGLDVVATQLKVMRHRQALRIRELVDARFEADPEAVQVKRGAWWWVSIAHQQGTWVTRWQILADRLEKDLSLKRITRLRGALEGTWQVDTELVRLQLIAALFGLRLRWVLNPSYRRLPLSLRVRDAFESGWLAAKVKWANSPTVLDQPGRSKPEVSEDDLAQHLATSDPWVVAAALLELRQEGQGHAELLEHLLTSRPTLRQLARRVEAELAMDD